ncbi:SseB family protein [Roseobacter weihaiensis]|uniref:SseB family protein n=1 Tax=Roseobacter weihaiensis TaxID=2763262 RepID=UPI001D0A1AF1|nr:SseB family protein [Roseobacter sp. H9]
MTDETPLDRAHAAMQADAESDAARLGFYERLADCELFLMLQSEVGDGDENVTPELFELEDARYVLVFDREERLAAFSGQITPYLALSGRTIAAMLADQGIGLGVNLEVAPSSILLPAEAVVWLHRTLGNAPDEVEARIAEVAPPTGLPERLVQAIDTKLATAMGLASAAYLVSVTYDTGTRGHLLGFVGAVPEAQNALAQAAAEALTFSGIEAGAMDVAFFRSADPVAEKLDRVGLRFDLPQPQETVTQTPAAPGSDPAQPPKLK